MNHTPEEEQLELALASVAGCAVTWLCIIQDREDLCSWLDFKDKLWKRFRPTCGGSIIGQFLRLRQRGSAVEYREELSADVPHVTNDVLEEMFLQGFEEVFKGTCSSLQT